MITGQRGVGAGSLPLLLVLLVNACGTRATEELIPNEDTVHSLDDVPVDVRMDAERTLACIKDAQQCAGMAPVDRRHLLSRCRESAKSGTKDLIAHAYHLAMARASYDAKDMLPALMHADSASWSALHRSRHGDATTAMLLKADVLSWTGDFDLAAAELTRALECAILADDSAAKATCHEALGWLHYRQEQYQMALDQWLEGLHLQRRLGNAIGEANGLRWVGVAHLELGARSIGRSYYDSSLALSRALRDPYLLYSIHNNIGQHMDSALYYVRLVGDSTQLCRTMHTAGLMATRTGDFGLARVYCENVLAYARSHQHKVLERDAVYCLKEYYKCQGDHAKAIILHEAVDSLNRGIMGDRTQERILQRTVAAEYQRRQLGDSIRYVHHLEKLDAARAMEQVRADRNRARGIAIAGFSLMLVLAGGLFYRKELERRKLRHERDRARLETKALRAQMNPHFLFNALHSLHAFIQANDAGTASAFLDRYTRLMRMVLEHSREEEIPLAKELEALEQYLCLERLRLNDRFDHQILVDPSIDIHSTLVPPLIIQPFVENAIWHGLAPKEGAGSLIVSAEVLNDRLLITVQDDGVGRSANRAPHFKQEPENKRALGSAISKDRLALFGERFGKSSQLTYVEVVQGTRVELDMPWVRDT